MLPPVLPGLPEDLGSLIDEFRGSSAREVRAAVSGGAGLAVVLVVFFQAGKADWTVNPVRG